ncbi:protein transport protein S31 [Dipsacomyces acuminosporus]|nr:protein transport protein S31 [Dipsacomyces acuminosporus]
MVYQYIERTAIPAWGPQQSETLIAAGTVAGAMDASFSNTSELEIFKLTAETEGALAPVGKVEASARFQRLAWSGKIESYGLGVLAGGLENGDITVWNPEKIISGEADAAVLHSSSAHTGAVGGLEFNPFQSNLMASGAGNGEVFIWDVVNDFKSYSPGARSQRIENVTDLSWNNQVQHILATASNTGSSAVWDLRSRREVIALNTPGVIGVNSMMGGGRAGVSAIAWNPASATQLVTASSDDNSPVIMLWDLRNANAPSQTFSGHQRGILSLSWCRKDAGLLLSSGKDNRTICWNPLSGEIVGELPPSNNWVYDVQWNQANPNLLSGASFDGRINLYTLARESDSIESTVAQVSDDPFAPQSTTAFAPSLSLKRPPKWLARPCGAVFGFGGKLVHFGKSASPAPAAAPGQPAKPSSATPALVSITEFVSEPELTKQAAQLEELLQNNQAAELCNERLQQSKGTDQERSCEVLKILFETDARDKLIHFLGFDKSVVKARIDELIKAKAQAAAAAAAAPPATESEEKAEEEQPKEEEGEKADAEESNEAAAKTEEDENPFAASTSADAEADDFFSKTIESSAAAAATDAKPAAAVETAADADIKALQAAFAGAFHIYDKAKDISSEDVDGLITRAVLLGDIEAAVELCIEQERFADALILATCGSPELAQRAQQAYFAKRAQQASYVRLLHGIVSGDLADVVSNADIGEWDEILALLCTYAQGDQFSSLCETLGNRLESAQQLSDAVLCYLASGNLDKVAAIWTSHEQGAVGLARIQSLHSLVEKVSVFRNAVQFIDPALTDEQPTFTLAPLYDSYVEYAQFLASQGLFDIAGKYLERVPVSYHCYTATGEDGLAALRNRLALVADIPWDSAPVAADGAANSQAAAQVQQPVQQQATGYPQTRAAPISPLAASGYPAAASAGGYPAISPAAAYPPTSMPTAQHYPSQGQAYPGYPAAVPAYSAAPAYPSMSQGYPQAQAVPSMFPPPPQPVNPASIPSGATPPPPQRKDGWNDAPMISKATKRPSQLAPKPAAIVSPFPQSTGTPPPAAVAPFAGARSPVHHGMPPAAGAPPPPRGGFVPASKAAGPPPPPPTAASMPFPTAQHAPHHHQQQQQQPQPFQQPVQQPFQQPFQQQVQQQVQQPFQAQPQQQHPGFAPSANPPAPVAAAPQASRGQVVAANPAAPVRTATPAKPATPKPATKYPAGDRSHLPAEWKPIVSSLSAHLARAKQFAAPAQKRMVDDSERRLNALFDLMNCDEVGKKEQLAPVFQSLVQAIDNRQFPAALHHQAELMTLNSDITTNLVGVKHLINVLKTLPM